VNVWKKFSGRRLWKKSILLAVMASSLMVGCATENYNPYMLPGAGLGAALGAGIGAAANNKNPLKGAAIGGLLGAAGGGIAGEIYGRNKPYPSPQQQGNYYNTPTRQPQGYYQEQQPDYGSPSS